MLRIFVITALLSLSANGSAGVLFSEIGSEFYEAYIHGEIVPSDFNYLVERVKGLRLVKQGGKAAVLYRLNSAGGDVRTAIQIGRFLRTNQAAVTIARDAYCASACVFVLAGAVLRIVDGRVAIHRPFNPADTDTSPDSQRATYKQLEIEIKKYLSDMNVSPTLYDDMLYISPDSAHILSSSELRRYGLRGSDPYFEQSQDAKRALELGISTRTLLQRRARAYTECGDISENMSRDMRNQVLDCHEAIERGKR